MAAEKVREPQSGHAVMQLLEGLESLVNKLPDETSDKELRSYCALLEDTARIADTLARLLEMYSVEP
ncbi:unnamed protein product [Notodromas monacha]|uniref:Uncharacterized protein n=1 Tax=Notodromas monacha TaxID=399045 RepID=A0A7R9BCS3_9CRUS|nr:unnamed protein product [Notodromas monacha]CAG0912388.1 unnamed protein product [Notodromas monacha]